MHIPARALVREVLEARGLETPFAEVAQEIMAKHTRGIGLETFLKERRRIELERMRNGRPDTIEKVEPVERHDQLHDFIKFACAVESIGGLAKAQAMLDHLELLYQLQTPEVAP